MTASLSIALAQLDPAVGDFARNLALVRQARDEAGAAGADLVVFPELVLIGYPPEDLVLRPALAQAAREAVEQLVEESRQGAGPALVVTAPWEQLGLVYNAAILVDRGVATVRVKHDLPNYGVFDEKRIFARGPMPEPVSFRGVELGVMICEDMWTPQVAAHLAAGGAEILVVPNGSPYEVDKFDARLDLARARVRETGLPLVYVNQVGGQDELVFDGASFVLDGEGRVAGQLPAWAAQTAVTRWRRAARWECVEAPAATLPDRTASIYQALVVGLRDYVEKNGFPGVVLGLSGGIDSALSAAVAVDALGPARVLGVRLPSRFTSQLSLDDAAACASRLGIRLETIPIGPVVEAAGGTLAELFAGRPPDVTEENVQARVRGLLLMALSNKFGHMLLTTGNKSEMSVGYATLYGDMCGGYSVLKDVYKTEVYRLARWRNAHAPGDARGPAGEVIPLSTITRPPTAELRPGQTDQDTLPPYDQLDAVLERLIEEEHSVDEIARDGVPRELVKRVQHMLYLAEYKRRQAPPGVKITRRSFGRDRRYPITNRFRDR